MRPGILIFLALCIVVAVIWKYRARTATPGPRRKAFIIGGCTNINDPTDQQIRAALESFTRDDVERSAAFVILESDETSYIQASGAKETGFALEYQEASLDQHFRATRQDFSIEEIVTAFGAYRDGDPRWKQSIEWQPLSLK